MSRRNRGWRYLWKTLIKKENERLVGVKVLDFRQDTGSDISTGDRGRSRVSGGAARSRALSRAGLS